MMKQLLVLVLLFVGFSGIIMAAGDFWFVFLGGYRAFEDPSAAKLRAAWPCIVFYAAAGLGLIAWGIRMVKRKGFGGHLVLIPLVVALCLLPWNVVAGVFGNYKAYEIARRLTRSNWIVAEAVSPDGRWRAYAREDPDISWPFELALEDRNEGGAPLKAGFAFMNGVKPSCGICWSPQGDIVVFQTPRHVIAMRVADQKLSLRPWGRDLIRLKMDYAVGKIGFPEPGKVSIEVIENGTGAVTVLGPEDFTQDFPVTVFE